MIWTCQNRFTKRIQGGHPWVYSNELSHSPTGVTPGELVELHDQNGLFLAKGFANPHSLIAFRVLTRDKKISSPISVDFLFSVLKRAYQERVSLKLTEFSYRLCFAESDGLPGLIIDRFVTAYHSSSGILSQTFVIQSQTAGSDTLLPFLPLVLEKLNSDALLWKNTTVILRRDSSFRVLENIPLAPPEILKKGEDHPSLTECPVFVSSFSLISPTPLVFYSNLFSGQKTGFFLDQRQNIHHVSSFLQQKRIDSSSPVRILDLCCYVGQWSIHLGKNLQEKGHPCHIFAVDASEKSLALAKKNLDDADLSHEIFQCDVFEEKWPDGLFDIIIVDPPALMKKKKQEQTAKKGYEKLAKMALERLNKKGCLIFCSCSGLLKEADLGEILSRSAQQKKKNISWVMKGSQSWDHPRRSFFPEGHYLKAWMGYSYEE